MSIMYRGAWNKNVGIKCVSEMLKQVQHDKEESMHCNRSWQVHTIGCHPEFISGSQGMLKQVQHDKEESMHCNRSWQVHTIGCHPEFISGSQGMLKQYYENRSNNE